MPGQPVLPCPQGTSTFIASEGVTRVPRVTLGGAGPSSGAVTSREGAEEVTTKLNCLTK